MALVVLGAVLLLIGTAARYLRNEVATRDAFADHAVEALEEEAVRDAIEQEIVAAVVSSSAQLGQARGEVRDVIDEVIAAPGFRAVFRSSTEELYRLYLEDEGANASLKLRRLGALVEDASPDLAREIPREFVVELVALRESGIHGEVLATARGLRVLGVVLPVLAALAFSAAIAAARNRARALMGVGVAAVACAALLAAALLILRAATLARIDGEGALRKRRGGCRTGQRLRRLHGRPLSLGVGCRGGGPGAAGRGRASQPRRSVTPQPVQPRVSASHNSVERCA